jgi:glutathione S-transferase
VTRSPTYGATVRELFHISTVEAWEQAQRDGAVTDSTRDLTLDEEGFIHCSYVEQAAATATRFYADLPEVVLLRIDPTRLTAPIVEEDLAGTGEPFPHVYGPIALTAIVDARRVSPERTGF